MIVELNGLPGCGKTTVKNLLINSINTPKKSIGVSEYSAECSGKIKRIFVKLKRFLSIINPLHFKFSKKCIRLYFKSSANTEFMPKSFYEDLIAVSYIIYLYGEYKKNKDKILVVDEGIIQVISSATTIKDMNKTYADDVIYDFLALGKEYLFINCECSVSQSLERIKHRNRSSAAIDTLKGKYLINYLNKYNESLNKVRQKVIKNKKDSFKLQAELSIDDQIKKVTERIEQI